jgi:hypothetical protein
MSSPVWKTQIKEGFKEGASTSNEGCIDGTTTCDPPPTTSQTSPPPPIFYQKLLKLSNNFNTSDAKKLYTDFIQSLQAGAKGFNETAAILISGLSPNPTADDKAILSAQVAVWIAVVPASYWFIVNWWYVLCYTNYTIDFRDYIIPTIHWTMAPPLHALELFNYYTLTIRMDSESPKTTEFFRKVWVWRPVVFSLFHAIMVGSMFAFSATDVVTSSMLNAGILSIFMSILSVYYFFSLCIKEEWAKKFIASGSSLVALGGFGLAVLSFIGMFALIAIICPIVTLYLLFLSYFVLLTFNNFWPPAVISICDQMFQELKEAPVENDKPIDKWGKFSNAVFQNAHSIYLLFIVVLILSTHLTRAMMFSSSSLVLIAIIINVGLAMVFAPSAINVVFELLGILVESDGKKPGGDEGKSFVSESDISI